MSMLVPPQMLNTMVPGPSTRCPAAGAAFTAAFYADPVRRYMLPVFSDRRTDWPSHPFATRDSLHEHDMWVAEGLTHRYPTKVLAELLPTCPQYCGHCTRMDLVGNSTPVIPKLKFDLKPVDRLDRDDRLPAQLTRGARRGRLGRRRGEHALEEPRVVPRSGCWRSRTSATSGSPPRRSWACRSTGSSPTSSRAWPGRPHRPPPGRQPGDPHARERGAVRDAARRRGDPRDARGGRARRAQPGRAHARRERRGRRPARPLLPPPGRRHDHAVLLLHVRHDPVQRALAGVAGRRAELQHGIMGYLPGFATPRIVCDVPFVGKRWVHQPTPTTARSASAPGRRTTGRRSRSATPRPWPGPTPYYDPIDTLPEEGQAWWRENADAELLNAQALQQAAASRAAAQAQAMPPRTRTPSDRPALPRRSRIRADQGSWTIAPAGSSFSLISADAGWSGSARDVDLGDGLLDRTRTTSSPGTPLRAPYSSARSAPM